LSEYLLKGKQVYIEGRLQTDEYTDKEGVKRKATKVRCDKLVLLGGGGGGGQRSSRPAGGDSGGGGDDPGPTSEALTDDDIPF
jgi:single-strand DNA-binding protein